MTIEVTHKGKAVSAEVAKKINETLKKTLEEELAKESRTQGGTGASPQYSGHARGD